MTEEGKTAKKTGIRPETLTFIFDYTKEAPERQIKDAEALDNKMVQIFSAASVVIGLAGISNATVTGQWIDKLLAVALILYSMTAVVSFLHLMPKPQGRSLHADKLWSKFWQEEVSDVQHSLVDDIGKAYAHNAKVIAKKGITLKIVTFTTATEVLLVGAALILSRLT